MVHYSLVQMSTWNYHLQKTNWDFFVNSLVAVWNGCCCSLQVTICSSVSGKSDESGNKLVMFSKNLCLAQTVFLSLVLVRSRSHTDVPWQPRITEGEQRKRWRRWRKQKWDTDRSWDTETGADGGCTCQHSGAFGFEVALLWQAEVTRLVQENVQATTMRNTLLWINVSKNEGKMQRMREIKQDTFMCSSFSFVCKEGFKSEFISS